jgi:hypothetical protein
MPDASDRTAEIERYLAALTSKVGVRFQPSSPVPDGIVGSIVRARMAGVDAALAARKG